MKLHFMGNYHGNSASLPAQRIVDGATPFREPSEKRMVLVVNIVSSIIFFVTIILLVVIGNGPDSINIFGFLLALLSIVPHELLHAICFREDVYVYFYPSKMMMFALGPEDMSKTRFILMSLLPNMVFGFLPFILFLIKPSLSLLGSMGAMGISMGAGDYINVYNALTQVPKGGLLYFYRMNTHWYMPKRRQG